MNTTSSQEIFEAVATMGHWMSGLGVQELTTFGNVTRPAESLALDILNEHHRNRVAQLIRDHPEQASAFLSILGDVRAELSGLCTAPVSPMTDIPKIHNLSAQAVIDEARRQRDRPSPQGT